MPLSRLNQSVLFDATAAGATLSKTLWPGPYTVTLPGQFDVASILNASGQVVGGVFASARNERWSGVTLDFLGVGAASQALVVEVGKVYGVGQLAQPLASVSLTSMVTSGTVTGTNPYTGVSTPGTTWRFFDLTAITAKGGVGQVLQNVGGTADNTPSQLLLDVSDGEWYYVLVTNLANLTEAVCVVTPF